jgi:hypothetical protein
MNQENKKALTAEEFLRKKAFPSGCTDEKWKEFKEDHSGKCWPGFAISAMEEYAALAKNPLVEEILAETSQELKEKVSQYADSVLIHLPKCLEDCRPTEQELTDLNSKSFSGSGIDWQNGLITMTLEKVSRILQSVGLPSQGDLSKWMTSERRRTGMMPDPFDTHKWLTEKFSLALLSKEEQITALQNFKIFVHKRLDEAGIPTHPEGEHSKHGCRIGDRLDIALAKKEQRNQGGKG